MHVDRHAVHRAAAVFGNDISTLPTARGAPAGSRCRACPGSRISSFVPTTCWGDLAGCSSGDDRWCRKHGRSPRLCVLIVTTRSHEQNLNKAAYMQAIGSPTALMKRWHLFEVPLCLAGTSARSTGSTCSEQQKDLTNLALDVLAVRVEHELINSTQSLKVGALRHLARRNKRALKAGLRVRRAAATEALHTHNRPAKRPPASTGTLPHR